MTNAWTNGRGHAGVERCWWLLRIVPAPSSVHGHPENTRCRAGQLVQTRQLSVREGQLALRRHATALATVLGECIVYEAMMKGWRLYMRTASATTTTKRRGNICSLALAEHTGDVDRVQSIVIGSGHDLLEIKKQHRLPCQFWGRPHQHRVRDPEFSRLDVTLRVYSHLVLSSSNYEQICRGCLIIDVIRPSRVRVQRRLCLVGRDGMNGPDGDESGSKKRDI